MLSEMFYKLWDKGLIQLGVWETLYMTLLSSLIAYALGCTLLIFFVSLASAFSHCARHALRSSKE